MKVEYRDGTQHTLLDGEDVSEAIRKNEVSMAASNISAHRAVREKMVEMQRKIAKEMSCVQKVDFETLHREILQRDKQDSEREFSPLKQADDAVVVDTSHLGIDEAVAKIKALIQSKI